MSRPPLHALQGFVSAVRLGNLSRAAGAMHLTVSALSHQMRALEQRLGYPLLQRHARGVTATPQGQQLLDRIAPHLDAIAEAFEPFGARREDTLTLSLTPSMASAWLVPRLGEFLASHPTIEINLLSSERLVDFERQQQVDAAMRIGAGQWPGVIAEPLFDEWLVPMASPALIARMGGVEAPPLHQWPLLGDPDDAWSRWFAAFGGDVPRRYVAVLDESEAHHRAALDGVGVALGRVTRARLLLASGQLVALSTQRLKTSWSHYLVYPPRSSTHGGFLAFRTWLQGQAREHAAHAQQATATPLAARRRKRFGTPSP
ncbi:LysR family transcriptional regulator [Xanthomonas citri pv. citri]|uniref:LysR substrate-binding domain-containing protein n=2 Tax=Xanthomonas citri TaxID=346 RepID=UPI0017482962|nr:LysR substrate-binding domain-containing protein [Xanthomonas citri]MBD4834890.1 LysR family transcriptional regulator [Xanthomonas citri pv. citri]MBD4863895.1 LysR family transcriptional regulator [Xanthomonas citri pv. citri]